jgi:hypothetical protein
VWIAPPFYDRTVSVTTLDGEISLDPDFENEPLSAFEPTVRRELSRDRTPAT